MSSKHTQSDLRPIASQKSAHALIGALSDASVEMLSTFMSSMFNGCDDQFFDLASRAKSNQEQHLYFESLREIRLKKPLITAEMCGLVEAGFRMLMQSAQTQNDAKEGQQRTRPEDLELVEKVQMEKDALITDMVSKARQDWQGDIYQLHERMQMIVPDHLDSRANPLDPGEITAAFVKACGQVDVELNVLKLLYKQFNRYVLQHLDKLYAQANKILIDAHILPNLSSLSPRKLKRTDTPEAADAAPAPAGAAPQSSAPGGVTSGNAKPGNSVLGSARPGSVSSERTSLGSAAAGGIPETSPEMRELAHLLNRLRSGGMRMPMFPDMAFTEAAGPPLPRDELVSMLSEVQLQPAPEGVDPGKPLDIRQAIASIAASRGKLSVGQADEDIINVVAMFFDIILDDRNLPIEIQALVSRLQLPILKVALKDRTFFTDRKHPARQLINEIARTSIGWESSSKDTQDALFIRLTELVEQVLQSSDDPSGIFEKCLADLMGFIERNDQRAAKIEKRTSEKAVASARIGKARDMVRHVLHERLEGKQLPAEITSFLVEDWQQVLQLVFLRQGKDSPEWIDAVQAVDDLVWSAQPHDDEKSRLRLERLLPELDRRLAAGLERTQSHEDEVHARLEVIRELQRKLLAPDSTPLPLEPLTPSQEELITPNPSDEEKSWKEMTAVERQKVKYEALMYEYLKRVDEIPLGTWLLYEDLRRGAARRCKLSARIEETRTFIFVNRVGVKVYDKPRKAFAYDMQMGHARVLEDTPLFDRTIERISSNLRKMTSDN